MYDRAAPQPEEEIQSFIVKVWLESGGAEDSGPHWGGHITHVPSRVRRSVRDLDDVVAFIASYLSRVGLRRGDRRNGDGA